MIVALAALPLSWGFFSDDDMFINMIVLNQMSPVMNFTNNQKQNTTSCFRKSYWWRSCHWHTVNMVVEIPYISSVWKCGRSINANRVWPPPRRREIRSNVLSAGRTLDRFLHFKRWDHWNKNPVFFCWLQPFTQRYWCSDLNVNLQSSRNVLVFDSNLLSKSLRW